MFWLIIRMKTTRTGIPIGLFWSVVLLVILTGCQTTNHFHAENLPRRFVAPRQVNAQELDLSGFAGADGHSNEIVPGDILEITISASLSQDDQTTIPVSVQDDGSAVLPEIGAVQLAGLERQAAEAMIRHKAVSGRVYPNPTVTVDFKQKKMNRVRVLGGVQTPGTYFLPPGSSDIVAAIAEAGGLSENAGENVDVKNPASTPSARRNTVVDNSPLKPYSVISNSTEITAQPASYTVNLASASKSETNGYYVQDGGVVMVEKRNPAPINVQGLVKKPDIYDFPIGKDVTVLTAISMAGGISNPLANKIFVVRQSDATGDEPVVIQVSLRKARRSGKGISNPRLQPGDTVFVEQTPQTVIFEALQLIRIGVNGTAGIF